MSDRNPDGPEGVEDEPKPIEPAQGVENAYMHHVLVVESGKPMTNGEDPWDKAKTEYPDQADGIGRLQDIAGRADRISEKFPGMYRRLVRKLHFSDVEDVMAQRMLTDILISRACEHRSTRSPEEMDQAAADLRRELAPDDGQPTARDIVEAAFEGRIGPEQELGPPQP